MFGLATSLKEIHAAIRRAEFRSLPTDTLLAKKSKAAKREVLQESVFFLFFHSFPPSIPSGLYLFFSKTADRAPKTRFRLNDHDDIGASLANEATIKRLTAENALLRTQVVRFLES